MRTSRFLIAMALLLGISISWSAVSADKEKGEVGKKSSDPLSEFKEEDRVKIDFCFNTFVSSISNGKAEVAKAFLAEVPKNLQSLDLKKEDDKKTFLQAYASMKNAQINSSQRMMGGIGQVGYTQADGTPKTIRMRIENGTWKIVGE